MVSNFETSQCDEGGGHGVPPLQSRRAVWSDRQRGNPTPMTSFYFPVALTIFGMLFYHFAQKSIPKDLNPFHATMIAYAVGFVLCAICALGYPNKKSVVDSLRESNWAVFLVGAAAACIELGFLLAYRAGWRISVAALATNVAGTLLLIPIGILIFKEHLSLRNILGVIFCVLGLILVVRD